MHHRLKPVLFYLLLLSVTEASAANFKKIEMVASPPPTKRIIQQIQSDFLQMERPLQFRIETKTIHKEPYYQRILEGEARVFQESYHPALICFALAPLAEDPEHDAEAYIILDVMFHKFQTLEWWPGPPTSFRSRSSPGDWAEFKKLNSTGGSAYSRGLDGIDQSQVKDWKELTSFRHYRIPPNEILPSSLKKKSKRGNWFSRLVSR